MADSKRPYFVEDIKPSDGNHQRLSGESVQIFYREMHEEFREALDEARRNGPKNPLRDAGLLPNKGYANHRFAQ